MRSAKCHEYKSWNKYSSGKSVLHGVINYSLSRTSPFQNDFNNNVKNEDWQDILDGFWLLGHSLVIDSEGYFHIFMAVLILALLHYITIASSKTAFSFYGSSAYGAVHGDQPMDRHSVHTAIKSLSVEEDIELNVPHPINGDTIASSKDDTVKKVEERTLPILRADSEPLKPSDQQETTYIHEDTSDRDTVPVRKILKEADVLNVNHNEKNILEQKVVFRNTFTHVEVVPTDTAPAIIATTAASPPIASLRAMTTSTSNSEVSKTTLELAEQEVTEIQTEAKSLRGRQDLGINSEMPSTGTFVINKEETKLAISSIDDLSQSSVLAPAIGEENLADSRHKLLEQKSSEDDDTDIFVDLDEKSDADIEFQDSEAIPSAVVRPSSTASTTPTCNTTIDESPMTGNEIFNLVMLFITLLPDVDEPSMWSKIIAGLQCALRDCRSAFPRLTTVATPIGNGTFIIRRARSECLCVIS